MARFIAELDIDKLRALAAQHGRPFTDAVAEYDDLNATGQAPMVYLDRGALMVGTRHADPRIVPADETEGEAAMRRARLRLLAEEQRSREDYEEMKREPKTANGGITE